MSRSNLTYKRGAWRIDAADKKFFDKDKLLLKLIEKLKIDIENNDPNDKKAQEIINELLYHYCWKLVKNDSKNNQI